jgi:hypothetical protein
VRVSVLVAELRKEIFRHRHSFHRKLRRWVCSPCQIEVGQETDFLNYHMLNEGVEKRIRSLAETAYGPAVNELLRVTRDEWEKHSYASSIGRPGKFVFGCAACNKELRTHADFQKHIADAIEKTISAYAKRRKSAA